jgi:hypothetical protein
MDLPLQFLFAAMATTPTVNSAAQIPLHSSHPEMGMLAVLLLPQPITLVAILASGFLVPVAPLELEVVAQLLMSILRTPQAFSAVQLPTPM